MQGSAPIPHIGDLKSIRGTYRMKYFFPFFYLVHIKKIYVFLRIN